MVSTSCEEDAKCNGPLIGADDGAADPFRCGFRLVEWDLGKVSWWWGWGGKDGSREWGGEVYP